MRPTFCYIILHAATIIFLAAAFPDYVQAKNTNRNIAVTARVDEMISYISGQDTTIISTNAPSGFILISDKFQLQSFRPESTEIESPFKTFFLSANF